MKMEKRLLKLFLVFSIIMTSLQGTVVLAENGKIDTEEITIYENTFDNGVNSVVSVSNAFLSYDKALTKEIQNSQFGENQGIRIKKEAWLDSQTFLFDFTKGKTEQGIYSGIISASFDFSMDKDSPANFVIIGANMSNAYDGRRMVYFSNLKYQPLNNSGDWGEPESKGTWLDADKIYNMKFVINLDEGKAEYYLDNELVGNQTNWTGVTVNNLSFALSGLLDYFDNLKLTVKYPSAIENIVTSQNIGNIFYEDEDMIFAIKVKNRHNQSITEDINFKITDAYGETVWNETKSISVSAKSTKSLSVNPELPKFGTYFMTVTSLNSEEFKIRFSRSVKATALNDKIGVCAHFDGRHPLNIPGMFDIMANAGFGTVRTDWGWKLNSDGTVYDYNNNGGIFEETINEANEHGIDILAILGVSHENYNDLNTDGGLNTADDTIVAYKEFTKAVAEDLAGKVEWFEIGNEDNYAKRYATESDVGVNPIVLSNGRILVDKDYVYTYPNASSGDYNTYESKKLSSCTVSIEQITDSSGTYAKLYAKYNGGILGWGSKELHTATKAYVFESGENYAKLLKAAYEGIKEGNPDALVLTSGSAIGYKDPDGLLYRNQQAFAQGLLGTMKEENDYFFDVYGTHPYHTAQAPEVVDRWIQNQDWSMQAEVGNELFETYSVPDSKALWATEFGYSSRDTESNSADTIKTSAWIVRTMLMNEIGGYHDKMYLYDILNDGLDASNSEHNYGMICYCKNETWNNVTAYAAKPQYLAMAQYNKMLAGAEFSENTKISDTIYKTRFIKEDDEIYVLWDVNNSGQSITLEELGDEASVYDMFGNELPSGNVGSVMVSVGENPVYVEFRNYDDVEIKFIEDEVVARIENNTEETIKPVLLTALYDDENILVECVQYDTYTVDDKQVTEILPGKTAYINAYAPREYINMKIFIFDGFVSLKPLHPAVIR